ncbi:MAG: hypothetical protein K2P78_06120 [Gemmataceae bacterium]|nr:hypothetical protein [Gemmataceae bacterium]
MPTVVVAPPVARWLTPAPTAGAGEETVTVPGDTRRAMLDALFAGYPTLRGYVLDEHGTMRHHAVRFAA